MKPTHTTPTDPDWVEYSYWGCDLDAQCENDYFNATNRITVKRFRVVDVRTEVPPRTVRMADWRKTKCCGTCALFPIEKFTGRVMKDSGTKCQWASVEVYPVSVQLHWNERVSAGYVRRDDGKDCPCYVKRESSQNSLLEKP